MEQTQVIDHIWQILTYAGAGIGGLLAKLAWDKIKSIEKRADDVESRSASIEKNYIHRFEEMNAQLTHVKEEIISKITDLRVCLAESYVKKSDLPKQRPLKK